MSKDYRQDVAWSLLNILPYLPTYLSTYQQCRIAFEYVTLCPLDKTDKNALTYLDSMKFKNLTLITN